ncbi:MAG: right-handed parallel beta-helix repeat-containing protein [Aquabacterium sp.]|nr:right-handed parallel beta-helix repeat-containing protein [Aquabacterium sp.]
MSKSSNIISRQPTASHVNGALSGSVTASPYAFNVDTSALANGSATLTAIAYDKAGNKASSSPVAVTVSNTTTTTTSGGTTTSGTTTTTTTDPTGTTTTSGTTTTTTSTTSTSSTTTATTTSTVSACLPSGVGTDYQVGPGTGQLASLAQVPWDKLVAGDTVRIFYSDTPYRGKFMISGNGTAAAPIRVCGVKSATGQRPIIDGQNAVSRLGLAYGNILHETRSIIVVKPLSTAAWTAFPSYIQIDGLELRGATPANTFTDSTGTVRPYETFGACIWLDRGQNVTIADNVIHDCTNGVYSKSTNDGDFAVTKNILLSGNYIYGNGVVGDEHEHNVYMESVNITYEFNRFEPLRAGALGNAIKDRSAGTVVRYNYINGGAHSIDLVEAEDFYTIASTYASYRSSFVYGNIIVKDGSTGSVIHYGGDHYYSTPGSTWGEPIFRAGTLYFYSNTLNISGTSAQVFQLSTTLESAQVWNNVFNFASTVSYPSLRATTDLNTTYWTAGGVLTLGKNWTTTALADSDPYHPVPGTVAGWANLIKGTSLPTDTSTYTPLSGSAIVNTAQADLSAVAAYPVLFQYDLGTFGGKARTVYGTAADIGAVERMSN